MNRQKEYLQEEFALIFKSVIIAERFYKRIFYLPNAVYIQTSTVKGDKNDSKLGGAFLGLMKIIDIPRFIHGILNRTAWFLDEVTDKSAKKVDNQLKKN